MTAWQPAAGWPPRGTLLLLPGRGEHPGIYARFGTRLAADGYLVRALDVGPWAEPAAVAKAAHAAAGAFPARPVVLAGSDTGALQALHAVAGFRAEGLLLAGLAPTRDPGPPASREVPDAPEVAEDFEAELAARTACPVHRRLLSEDARFARGALAEPVPPALRAPPPAAVPPVLLLHGDADPITPLAAARDLAARLPGAELAVLHGGLHDVLNDAAHRTVASAIVQWLERLRGGPGLAPLLTVHTTPSSPSPLPSPAAG